MQVSSANTVGLIIMISPFLFPGIVFGGFTTGKITDFDLKSCASVGCVELKSSGAVISRSGQLLAGEQGQVVLLPNSPKANIKMPCQEFKLELLDSIVTCSNDSSRSVFEIDLNTATVRHLL